MRSRHRMILAGLLLVAASGTARAAPNDAIMARFFAIWDADAAVTPRAVQTLYARQVTYYGRAMSNDAVYAEKRAFIRRWPDRRYRVVPGTASETCDAAQTRCRASVLLAWHAASPARGASAGGWTRVAFGLVREDGELKIASESGRRASRPD